MELLFYVQHIKDVVQYEHFSLGCMLYSIYSKGLYGVIVLCPTYKRCRKV